MTVSQNVPQTALVHTRSNRRGRQVDLYVDSVSGDVSGGDIEWSFDFGALLANGYQWNRVLSLECWSSRANTATPCLLKMVGGLTDRYPVIAPMPSEHPIAMVDDTATERVAQSGAGSLVRVVVPGDDVYLGSNFPGGGSAVMKIVIEGNTNTVAYWFRMELERSRLTPRAPVDSYIAAA